ncbi:Protein of unknown function [Oceanobacillus limi]|uniref:DUF3231 family protein n=1 Tax=Oceanobacillus limi TaxID=930131 RepID=A0A1I0CC17_9BACI|nr:DUF3231 family protein [Oceanobacillus limi]SET17050.1 Protein of unknown function [Oceanobacillus limi]
METEHPIRLTSAELSSLWSNYMFDSMSICVFTYFLEKVKDEDIQPIIQQAMNISIEHIDTIEQIFADEGIAIPIGFTEEDVNTEAPQLFLDTLFLHYIKHMAKGGMAMYGIILPNIIREDIREFFSNCLASTTELYNESTSLLLSKGIDIRPPYIPYQKDVSFVEKQNFLAGWFGEQRPYTGQEVMHLYANVQTNKLGEALSLGFAQVAKLKKVRSFMQRGKEIANKHTDIFANYLRDYDLPVPMTWDHEVLESTESPFSDKLMMYHISLLNGSGIGNYGSAISMSQRRDLITSYTRLTAEVGLYAEDGMNLMIDNGWLERPPHASDRGELIKHKR